MLSDDLLPGAGAAAAFIGIKRSAVYHLVERGQLPAVRLGGRLYFRRSELNQVFSTSQAQGTGGTAR